MANKPRCRRFRFLFKLVPFASLKYGLLQRHLLDCPECSKDAAGIEEARSSTYSREGVAPTKDLWPAVSRRLGERPGKVSAARRLTWSWVAGTIFVAALAWILILSPFRSRREEPAILEVDLRIGDVTLYDQPAQAFIFKTQDPNRTFVWVEKN